MIAQATRYICDRKGNLISQEDIGEPYDVPGSTAARMFLRIFYGDQPPETAIEVLLSEAEKSISEGAGPVGYRHGHARLVLPECKRPGPDIRACCEVAATDNIAHHKLHVKILT
jgi:hypothetical protein